MRPATELELDRYVALKFLRYSVPSNGKSAAEALEEPRVGASIRYDNVVPTHVNFDCQHNYPRGRSPMECRDQSRGNPAEQWRSPGQHGSHSNR